MNLNRDDGTQRVTVANVQPYNTIGFSTIIPPKTAYYTQTFGQAQHFHKDESVYISRMIVRIDTTGFWNIPVTEVFQKAGVPTTIAAGNYSDTQLQSIANVVIQSGANNYLILNNQPLQFAPKSNLQYVLGYQSFGTVLIPAGTLSTDTINSTGDLDVLYIASDLVNLGTPLGTNYITAVPSNIPVSSSGQTALGGAVEFDTGLIHYPLTKRMFNSINWVLNTAKGDPYIIQTDIVIFTQISMQKK